MNSSAILDKLTTKQLTTYLRIDKSKAGNPSYSGLTKQQKIQLILDTYAPKVVQYKQDYVRQLQAEHDLAFIEEHGFAAYVHAKVTSK